MDQKEFVKYLEVLKDRAFSIYPSPGGPDQTVNWRTKKFIYVDDSPTHVTIQDVNTQKNYDVPLALVEFANRGVLRVLRPMSVWNGSFV
jgi:hypothetical protein